MFIFEFVHKCLWSMVCHAAPFFVIPLIALSCKQDKWYWPMSSIVNGMSMEY